MHVQLPRAGQEKVKVSMVRADAFSFSVFCEDHWSYEEKVSNHRRRIPRLPFQGLKFGKLAPFGWHRIEQHHLAVLSRNEEHVGEKNKLAVAITAIFPLQFGRCEIEIGEDARRGSILIVPPSVGWRCDGTWGSEAPRTRSRDGSRDGCAT